MSLPYYKRFPRDFLEGTIGLSLEVKGAYAIVLDLIYVRGGLLPDDPRFIAGQLGCSVRKWTAIRNQLVTLGKLKICGGLISNSRADYLIEETRKYRDKQAEIASTPRKNNDLRQPKGSQPEPEPEPELDIEANASCPAKPNAVPKDDKFSEAWKAYPAKGRERSKSQAKTRPIWKDAARLAGGEDALLGAVRRYVRDDQTHKGECGPPAFDRWLRDGRWEHWLPAETQRLATWTGPAEIRARVVAERGEGFAASYLDPAAWSERGEIFAATGYAAEKLRTISGLRVSGVAT